MDPKWARPWFAATAACVAAGIIVQFFVTASDSSKWGDTFLARGLNIFAFFTVQSNLIVGATALLLALDPDRASTVFRAFRLSGLVGITVTFIVFHVALSHLLDLDTWGQTANQLLHTVVPILTVVGWVAFGPRGHTSARIARLTVLFPLAYMAFTMVRGPLSADFYPYPFANVAALGYARVLVNAFWIALLFVSIAAGATALDKRLSPAPGQTPSTP
ncbi:MAG: hypothetical protein JWQ32_759 [Marmoricola sp.]|nr:hypothetical protein [Marmoricola sp.]